jgi:AGZA family xanthine/uracil permease-like MFS transporter
VAPSPAFVGRFQRGLPRIPHISSHASNFSIATGLSLGLLSFTLVKLGTGRHREIGPLIWVLSALFLLRYAFLGSE